MRRIAQDGALVLALLVTIGTLSLVPSWRGWVSEVCHLAGLGAGLVMCVLVLCRLVGPPAVLVERLAAALFLAAMPVVYVVRWLQVDRGPPAALAVEIGGLLVFAALAAIGLRRSPWFLVAGIAAHGIGWDAWHWLFGSTFMFDWYAMGCLACDLALAAYLAFRVQVWRSSPRAVTC